MPNALLCPAPCDGRRIPDDVGIPSPAVLARPDGAMLNFAFTEFSEVRYA
jgi:hypothetical protein